MKFIKINHGYAPDPNIAEPHVVADGANLIFSFPLNYFIYAQYKKDDVGTLIFKDWYSYRIGSPNDESFYNGNNPTPWSHKNFPEIEFHNFYQIKDSNWKEGLGLNTMINKAQNISDGKMRKHYICFMKGGTLEVIACGLKEQLPKK